MSEDKKTHDVDLNDVKDMTIGSLQEMFEEEEKPAENPEPIEEVKEVNENKSLIERLQEKVDEDTKRADEADSHILSQYIMAHKKGYQGPSWEEGAGMAILTGEAKNLAQLTGVDDEAAFEEEVKKNTALKEERKAAELKLAEEEKTQEIQKLMEEAPNGKNLSKELDEKTALDKFLKEEPKVAELSFDKAITKAGEKTPEDINEEEISAAQKKNSYKKVALIAASVIALGGAGYAGYQAFTNHQARQAVMNNARLNADLQEVQSQIQAFYTDSSGNFIRTDKISNFPALLEQLNGLEKAQNYEQVRTQMDELQGKVDLVKNVNALFTNPAIKDNALAENLILARYQAVNVSVNSASQPLNDLANKAITEAKAQYDTIKVADEKVTTLSGQVENANQADLDAAMDLIQAVKNPTIKESLINRLSDYKAALAPSADVSDEATDGNASVAGTGSGSVAQDVGSAGSGNAGTQADNSGTAGTQADGTGQATGGNRSSSPTYVGNSDNPDGIGIEWFAPTFETFSNLNQAGPQNASVNQVSLVPYNPEAVANHTDPRWQWAPGVQERVIRALIGRGNIGWSGWYLNPVNIINGNPYYNLISADGTYIVSINAATGWFRGLGHDSIAPIDWDPETAVFG